MVSIVVPVFNEEESIGAFFTELKKVFPKINDTFETIFIDDGSTDRSLDLLKNISETHKNVRVFSFRRNMGKSEALTLGFAKAQGDYIVTLDADLQDKPSEIPSLLKKAKEGAGLVCGWRKKRKDKKKMLAISRIFNKTMNTIFSLDIHDYNCGFKVYTKDLAKSLRLYGGLHRFIPLIAAQNGFSVVEEEVVHEQRKFGKSKYGFSKVFKDIPDMFTMLFLVKYGKRPMHFFGIFGGGIGLVGFIILVYLTVLRFLGYAIGGRPLLLFGILLFITGLQIFFTGFLADLFINISQNRLDSKQSFPLKFSSE